MHKTEKTAKESRMNVMYIHLCDTAVRCGQYLSSGLSSAIQGLI
jgi:hypothetical protein